MEKNKTLSTTGKHMGYHIKEGGRIKMSWIQVKAERKKNAPHS